MAIRRESSQEPFQKILHLTILNKSRADLASNPAAVSVHDIHDGAASKRGPRFNAELRNVRQLAYGYVAEVAAPIRSWRSHVNVEFQHCSFGLFCVPLFFE
jgi:hypothetical protein